MTPKTITITGTGLTGKQWITRLWERNYKVSKWAKEIILSPEFDKQRLKKGEEQTITFVKHSEVGNSPTTEGIQLYAKAKGYGTPSPELALLIREQVSDEEMEAMGLWYIVSLHDPIKDSGGGPGVLLAYRGDDGRWVGTYWDDPDDRWNAVGASAFPVSASGTGKLVTQPSDTLNFALGQKVKKVGGDYTFEGEVRGVITKASGQVRVVVENKDGVLHIFNPKQLI